MLTNKTDIEQWLRTIVGLKSTEFTINDDLTVDTNVSVIMPLRGEITKINELPIQFNSINGDFIWHYCPLTSLKGFPKRITGNGHLDLSHSIKLINLEGCPQEVNTISVPNQVKLESIYGIPRRFKQLNMWNTNIVNFTNEWTDKGGVHIENKLFFSRCPHISLHNIHKSISYVGTKIACLSNEPKDGILGLLLIEGDFDIETKYEPISIMFDMKKENGGGDAKKLIYVVAQRLIKEGYPNNAKL